MLISSLQLKGWRKNTEEEWIFPGCKDKIFISKNDYYKFRKAEFLFRVHIIKKYIKIAQRLKNCLNNAKNNNIRKANPFISLKKV